MAYLKGMLDLYTCKCKNASIIASFTTNHHRTGLDSISITYFFIRKELNSLKTNYLTWNIVQMTSYK